MKTTIIKILNQIANGEEPPRRIYYKKGNTYIYNKEEKDYESEVFVEYLFDSHIITDILNDEVEILETTITYKQDNIENNKQDNKIKKLEIGFNTKLPNGAETENIAFLMVCINWLAYKTNELIDRWNDER